MGKDQVIGLALIILFLLLGAVIAYKTHWSVSLAISLLFIMELGNAVRVNQLTERINSAIRGSKCGQSKSIN